MGGDISSALESGEELLGDRPKVDEEERAGDEGGVERPAMDMSTLISPSIPESFFNSRLRREWLEKRT